MELMRRWADAAGHCLYDRATRVIVVCAALAATGASNAEPVTYPASSQASHAAASGMNIGTRILVVDFGPNGAAGTSRPVPQANLTLSDYHGNGELETHVSYFDSTSTTKIAGGTSWVSTDGLLYAGTDLPTGTYDLYVKVRGFLRKKFDNVTITNGTYGGLTATLLNGDINGDNTIDVADYAYISSNFNLTDADSTWERVDANLIAPKDCDLNGDGSIDIADYAIVSENFNREGD